MKKVPIIVSASLASLWLLGPPAYADGYYVYNSDDHDAKAKFFDYGEKVDLCKLNDALVYVRIRYTDSNGSLIELDKKWYDGGIDTCTDPDLNYAMPEGRPVQIKVCEYKAAFPDDCSPWSDQGRS